MSASISNPRAAAGAVALAVSLTVAASAGCDGTSGPVLSVPSPARPKLLYTPSEEPTGVAGLTYLRDHVRDFEAAFPFDGIAVDVGLGDTPWGTVTYTRAQFEAEVQLLRATPFAKLTDNFQMFNVRTGGVDWFDDAAFGVVIGNARAAAEVVRDAGLRGLFFDVEQYDAPVWFVPDTADAAAFAAQEAQARRRGAAFMTALLDVKPDITVITTVSFSEVFRAVCLQGEPLAEDRYRLLPAFLDGMFEARAAARAPALIVDGFLASYAARDPRSFPLFRELEQGSWDGVQARYFSGVTSYRFATGTITWPSPPGLRCTEDVRAKLSRDMPAGFGVMLDYETIGGGTFHREPADFDLNFFTPARLATTLTAALGSAERYVFLWSATMDFIGVSAQPPPPAAYVQALASARGNP